MRAITIREPWASLVELGLKRYETRSWGTKYRGKLLIHASARKMTANEMVVVDSLPTFPSLEGGWRFGYVVAMSDLLDCVLMSEEFINQQSELERMVGNWQPGWYAWKLHNTVSLITTFNNIKATGQQKLWIPPTELVEKVDNKLALTASSVSRPPDTK